MESTQALGERYALLVAKRDAIESVLGTKADYVEVEMAGRRHRVPANTQNLEYLSKEIEKVERRLARRGGSSRNIAYLRWC